MALPKGDVQVLANDIAMNASQAASSAAQAAKLAADSALQASQNANVAAKAAADSATAIAVVATDTSWMKKSLTRVEETLSTMSNSFVSQADHKDVLNQLSDHETRIRTLENNMLKWMGGIAVITFIITIAVSFLLKFIG
jgi:hypothetical protein